MLPLVMIHMGLGLETKTGSTSRKDTGSHSKTRQIFPRRAADNLEQGEEYLEIIRM